MILTSIRLPLQRQISWFRQQNKQFEDVRISASSAECERPNNTLLTYFDEWSKSKRSASQWFILQERKNRQKTAENMTALLEQFSFIFVKERMKESFECLCVQTGMRLCSADYPLEQKNQKPTSSCVEKQLLDYRSAELIRGAVRDLLLYEAVNEKINRCQYLGIPGHCICPVVAQGNS